MTRTVKNKLTPRTCAASGCDNPVPDRNGTPGRPFLYCSPQCRPSSKPHHYRPPLTVDIHQDNDADNTHNPRTWTVALRRGADTVIIGDQLGRFSATALARDLQQLIHPPPHQGGPTD